MSSHHFNQRSHLDDFMAQFHKASFNSSNIPYTGGKSKSGNKELNI